MFLQVKEEIGSYGLSKMEKRQFVDKETILERNYHRKRYRDGALASLQQPHTPVKEQGEKQYSCKARLTNSNIAVLV